MSDFDIDAILAELDNACVVNIDDSFIKSMWLGELSSLNPSGKIYTCWTSNVTDAEAENDEEYWSNVEEEMSHYGLFLVFEDCSVYVARHVKNSERHEFCKNLSLNCLFDECENCTNFVAELKEE